MRSRVVSSAPMIFPAPPDTTALFAKLASETSGAASALRGNVQGAYATLGIIPARDGSYSGAELLSVLKGRLKAAIPPEPGSLTGADLKALATDLLVRHALDELPVDPGLRILEFIIEALGQSTIPQIEDTPTWRTLTQLGRDCLAFDIDPTWNTRIAVEHPREINLGRAARLLRDAGYTMSVRGGHVEISSNEASKISLDILNSIQEIGALLFISSVLATLRFNERQGRYELALPTSQIMEYRPASVPVGYMLRLAIRACSAPPPKAFVLGAAAKHFENAYSKATALVSIYDVERYSMWEGFLQTPATLVPFLRRVAVSDSTFSLVQMRPADVGKFLRGVFDWVDESVVKARCNFSVVSVIEIAERIMTVAQAKRGPQTFMRNDLASAIGADRRDELDSVLDALTHGEPPNSAFALPHDVTKDTFRDRPLLPGANGAVVLVDASWCAPAFYEAIATRLRKAKLPTVDEQIGLAAERLIRSELRAHGVPVVHGTYTVAGEDGECDCAAETPSTIVLFELKKKALRFAARSEDDVALLVDLSKSLLDAQLQLAGHEARLLEFGGLELDDNGVISLLTRQGRDIERIAVSLLDYGMLQDRVLIDRILRLVAGSKLSAAEVSAQKELDKIMADGGRLLEKVNRIGALDPGRADQPFFNCWFLSVPQILILLDGVDSPASLWERLRSPRHVTTGRLDFYAELAMIEGIKAESAT
jgi:hypothetical protein